MARLGEENLEGENRKDAGDRIVQPAQHLPVALQPGGQDIGGDNDADADRQRHYYGPEPKENQLAGDVRIGGADELRQEGHEEDDDLRVQEIDPDAVQQGGFQGGLRFLAGGYRILACSGRC